MEPAVQNPRMVSSSRAMTIPLAVRADARIKPCEEAVLCDGGMTMNRCRPSSRLKMPPATKAVPFDPISYRFG